MKSVIRLLLCAAVMFFMSQTHAQHDDPILFSVADLEVPVSEFDYIYQKNNRDEADYSTNSVMEYLDLYIKFKLKVKRALDLQLDTIEALQEELAGYRKQLATSYLNDKEVTQKLVAEAYKRMQEDIRVSHILVKVEPRANEGEVAMAREKAEEIRKRIDAGESFESLAQELSEDTNSAPNGGDLGYVTALLPDGFYKMESAIYGMQTGEVSQPVRSKLGFHLLKVTDRRPARGQREISHILVRVKEDGSNAAAARQKIDALYQSLKSGKEFEQLARSISDDNTSAPRGGYIGKIRINMYDKDFEEAAFAIEKEGDISEPVRTRIGWHIIKLLKDVELGSLEEEAQKIEARIARDERMEIARKAMIDEIKEQSGFTWDKEVLDELTSGLSSDFLSFQWQVPTLTPKTLISFKDGTQLTNIDFAEYLRANTRMRMRAQKGTPPAEVAEELFESFVDEQCLAYEEQMLDEKYPEFAALMREYKEGILLFEVTKMKVWDKASQDTAGLRAFYQEHKEDYMWPERARVQYFTVDSDNPKVAAKARKLAGKHDVGKVQKRLNKKNMVVNYRVQKYTAGDMEKMEIPWEAGWISTVEQDQDEGTYSFTKVVEIIPPTPKQLDEARGYIIADYQDQLEKKWLERLREMYEVDVRQNVLQSLIRGR